MHQNCTDYLAYKTTCEIASVYKKTRNYHKKHTHNM